LASEHQHHVQIRTPRYSVAARHAPIEVGAVDPVHQRAHKQAAKVFDDRDKAACRGACATVRM
jgi:hypothetical protein